MFYYIEKSHIKIEKKLAITENKVYNNNVIRKKQESGNKSHSLITFGGDILASSNIETKVEELLKGIIENIGYELYDVRYEKEGKDYYLRVIIDKPEGIDINDCEKVNNSINDILDEVDYIKDQYFLEVSSPGLERILRKDKHFEKQIGNEISIKLFKAINKQKELIGILEEYNKDEITIKVEDETLKINLKDIAIAKTVFNW